MQRNISLNISSISTGTHQQKGYEQGSVRVTFRIGFTIAMIFILGINTKSEFNNKLVWFYSQEEHQEGLGNYLSINNKPRKLSKFV